MVITYIDGEKVVHERPAKYQVKMKVPGPSLVKLTLSIPRSLSIIGVRQYQRNRKLISGFR